MHDRREERARLKRKLEAGVNIHMPAPRRIGKTWTVNRLAADLRDADWVTVEVDVEGLSEPKEFARELCLRIEGQSSIKERFKTHALQRIGNLLGGEWGEKPLDALGRVDPIEFAETLIASLHDSSERAAILIDEVAYFFLHLAEKDPSAAHGFAYRLRAIQQRYRNVRWLLTGSIGLDTIARRYGLEGAFVDFEVFVLEPFTAIEARSYMRDPNVQMQFSHMFAASDEDLDGMFSELGWLAPHYLKLVANEVRPSVAGVGSAPPTATAADFEAAFDTLLKPNRRDAFCVWAEHIDKNLPEADRALAKHLLAGISQTVAGEIAHTLIARAAQAHPSATPRQVQDVLDMLMNDGLIDVVGERYAFRSGLIRRYWSKYEA